MAPERRPDAAIGHSEREESDDALRDLLEEVQAEGVEVRRPTLIRHFLYFKNRAAADRAAKRVAGLGFLRASVRRSPEDQEWLLLIDQRAVPDVATISTAKRTLGEAATREGGEYDGWEVDVEQRVGKERAVTAPPRGPRKVRDSGAAP